MGELEEIILQLSEEDITSLLTYAEELLQAQSKAPDSQE